MSTNIESYKEDLKRLLNRADLLHMAIQYEYYPEKFLELLGDKAEQITKHLSSFNDNYQSWYSEATALIRQLLPDRLDDFRWYYDRLSKYAVFEPNSLTGFWTR
jgi:hypothetical protein